MEALIITAVIVGTYVLFFGETPIAAIFLLIVGVAGWRDLEEREKIEEQSWTRVEKANYDRDNCERALQHVIDGQPSALGEEIVLDNVEVRGHP